jgi:hypothetical protein
MVLQDGPDSWACLVKGQNNVFSRDPSQALGYADPFLKDYLINTAQKFAISSLLAQFGQNNASLSVLSINDPTSNITFPAIYNSALQIIILLNATDYLTYIIRTYEDHAIFGNSTNDLILINYTKVEADEAFKLLPPHRFQTRYNTAGILEYFLVESITINAPSPRTIFPSQPASTPHQLNRLHNKAQTTSEQKCTHSSRQASGQDRLISTPRTLYPRTLVPPSHISAASTSDTQITSNYSSTFPPSS